MKKISTADEKAAHITDDNALEQAEINACLIENMTDAEGEPAILNAGDEEHYARLIAILKARKMDIPKGVAHGMALLQILSEPDATYLVLLVTGDDVICERLLVDGPGELVDVNFGFDCTDVHFVRTGEMTKWDTAQLHDAQPGNVYVVEIDLLNKRARVVDQGVLLGAAAAQEEGKIAARDAMIAKRKKLA